MEQMKPYPRKFNNAEEAVAYLKERGKLHLFGVISEMYYVYNFHHNDGRKFHMNLYIDGNVTYEEMSPIQYAHWRGEGW